MMPDFGRELDDWSRNLSDLLDWAADNRTNEMELREDANGVIAPAIADLYGLSLASMSAERAPARGSRRSYDKLYGGVVVEWEWGGEARRRGGAEQTLDYLGLVRSDIGDNDAFTAVVCDGHSWGFLAIDPGSSQLGIFESNLKPYERFEWHANSPSACRRFLELVGSHRKVPLTDRQLASSFGPSSNSARSVIAMLSESLAGRVQDDRIDTLYREWRRSLDVAYGDLDSVAGELAEVLREAYDLHVNRSVGEYLFSVHTYFALVARLLAIEVLAISTREIRHQPTNWEALDDDPLTRRLQELEDGRIPSGLDIQNLFEGDVFSWYLDATVGNVDLLNGIRQILATMSTLAFPRVAYGIAPANDILRDLYQVLVPRALRRKLGEFLTPTWLAESCLIRLGDEGADMREGRVLDPTCGTGTFLMPLVRQRVARLRTQVGSERGPAVQELLGSIAGFDINPVAVIAARVNFLLALGDLAAVAPITLPVWRADSILVPDAAPREAEMEGRLTGRPWQRLATSLPFPFPIPPQLATAPRMSTLRRILETAAAEPTDATADDLFQAELVAAFGADGSDPVGNNDKEWDDVLQVSIELFERMRKLVREKRNGVWARIIQNSFAPLFAGTFDVVVGNPPWLTWTRLPQAWRDAAEPVWRRYGLWTIPVEPGRRRSTQLASTDMAVLVFARATDMYLRDQGFIGLLTPDSLITGDPGARAFRRFRLREDVDSPDVDIPLSVLHVDNWSDISPFSPDASNRPIFLTAKKGEFNQYPIATTKWTRSVPGVRLEGEWRNLKDRLTAREGQSTPVDPNAPTSAWSFQPDGAPRLIAGGTNPWEFGKGLDTRGANGVFFVNILQSKRREGRVLVENGISGRNDAVEVTRNWVESKLVHPLLRGRDVAPWLAIPSAYIVCPYLDGAFDTLLSDSVLRADYPGAWQWLRRHRTVLSSRTPPPTRSWDITGSDWARLDGPMNHMGGDHLVVVREQSQRPAAAVVTSHFDENLGRTASPLVDHKLSFCSVPSQDEALYLCAFLNSTPIQDLLASFSNTVAVAPQTLARLPIPEFLGEQPHMELVTVARRIADAHNVGETVDREQAAIDDAVLKLLSIPRADYRPQPRPATRVRKRSIADVQAPRLFNDPEDLAPK
jgi:hypothetical protein